MRIMLDTNILISIIFFPSGVTREFTRQVGLGNRIVLCDYVIEELRLVVDRKFPERKKILEQFFYELPFELVYTPKDLNMEDFPAVRDSKDTPILATAILENIESGKKENKAIGNGCSFVLLESPTSAEQESALLILGNVGFSRRFFT